VPLSLVFILFPAVAQVVAMACGERPMGVASLALLALVLGPSLIAFTGRGTPPDRAPARTTPRPALATARRNATGCDRAEALARTAVNGQYNPTITVRPGETQRLSRSS
jgi:hypothetical protein